MTTLTVPDTIARSKVRAFLADLGIDDTHLREFRCGIDGVYIELAATDERGRPYLTPGGDLALHTISMRLDQDA